ncbi:TIGR02678 family protein [Panacagrimonas sp.]|uniref:TIGR02678 family protein n=1 Tax=Panacagrimonas sp. TaxID=2480088 RepID=UPI003B51DEAE
MATEDRNALDDILARQRAAEFEQALRALLMQPLLPASHAAYALVRRHLPALREWLMRETGWVLLLDRECARLYKRPGALDDATRGAAGFDGALARERYVLLCLVCAVLERAEPQITLQVLGERVLEAALDEELAAQGFRFTLEAARERRDLVHVCRYLLQHGALSLVAGDDGRYVERGSEADVLYDVHRRVLAALPGSSRGASWLATAQPQLDFEGRLAAMVEEFSADSEQGRRDEARHRIARCLLDDPVVYHDELAQHERDYLASQRGPMSARLADALGLVAELRAEGLALVDPDSELTDVRMPAVGTEAHATLLVAEYLAKAERETPGRLHTQMELAAFLRAAADRHGQYWNKAAREPGAESGLAEQAVNRLVALKLLRRHDDRVRARPALLRYGFVEPQLGGSDAAAPKQAALL